jgi:hypothetical protein
VARYEAKRKGDQKAEGEREKGEDSRDREIVLGSLG